MVAPIELLGWSARICCAGIFFQAAELMCLAPEMREGRLLGWHGRPREPNGRLFVRTQGYAWRLGVVLIRLAGTCAVFCLPVHESYALASVLTVLFATQLFFNRRFRVILANSDFLNLCCLGALSCGTWPGASPGLQLAAAGFIAFQACLGYVASGVDKLAGANWRSGDRITDIFQNSSHRSPALGRWLAAHRPAAAALSFGVIALEILFPLCLVLPSAAFWSFVFMAAAFHAGVAVLMALPGFFWAFAATYPAMYAVHGWLAVR